MAEFKYEIVEQFGVVSETAKGWTRQLNFIKWNDYAPKYDLREWSPDGEKMGKGLSMSKDEIISLRDLLNTLDIEADPEAPIEPIE